MSKKTPSHQSPFTVLIIADSYLPHLGGGPRHVEALVKGLESKGIRVRVFSPRWLWIGYRLLWTLAVVPQILWVGYWQRARVIHSQGYHSGLTALIAARLLRIPVMHTIHGTNTLDIAPLSIKAKLEWWFLYGLNYDLLFSVSSHIKRYTDRPFHLISNGVDLAQFSGRHSPVAGRILTIGRDDDIKNHHWLRGVFPLIKHQVTNAELRIVTGGKSNLEIAREFHQASVFVLPSRSEGQPVVILEAMAAGVPVVATKVGGVVDLIEDGVTGHIVDVDDTEAFVTVVVKLLSDTSYAHRIAKAAKRKLTRYTWDKLVSQTLKEYRTCQSHRHM